LLTRRQRQMCIRDSDYTKQVQDMHDNFTWDKAKQNWLAFDETI
jgi:hypothetical protein